MKLYRLITGPDDANFCFRVTEALNKGWELHGAPTLTHDGKTAIAGQALLKEAEGIFTSDIDFHNL
ncbi:MAG: DUF1737 domain-containing protein [Candidatus Gracilibacteria bacterium]|nr:DUF1737 domain-containing protein [Candidatus Gracilibacteria bacterium]